jgi:eukaryotic-like serine/threonine-protein kinase
MSDYEKQAEEFFARSRDAWHKFVEDLIGSIGNESGVWKDPVAVCRVLNAAAAECPHNHMFCPMGGGLDLKGAEISPEDGCIDLDFGALYTVQPLSLSLHRIGGDDSWSYLRLETNPIAPKSGDAEASSHEELVRLPNGLFLPRWTWDEGTTGQLDDTGKDEPLPAGSQLVVRCVAGGAFVLFAKGSLYNQNSATYDARHANMSAAEFAQHIHEVAAATS